MAKPKVARHKDGMSEAGRSILRGLNQIHAALKSDKPLAEHPLVTVHEVEVPDPKAYSAKEIQGIRIEVLGVSQPVFAKMLGTSAELVKSWEQGRREPSPMARRVLDIVAVKPKVFVDVVLEDHSNGGVSVRQAKKGKRAAPNRRTASAR